MIPSFCSTLICALLAIGMFPISLGIQPGFPYGSTKVRGVSLGGWLLLEPWITPSLFDGTGNPAIIDEWTFCRFQDRTVAKNKLTAHWNTFITESDFAAIAAAGLNHVRLPIGYWAFDVGPGEPYIQGQLAYLQNAVTWARNHKLKLIVDLHGAPGSQNGFDNSGHKVPFPKWHSNQTNIARTNAIIKRLANMFKNDATTVPIIAPLNEPAGFLGNAVLTPTRQFWFDSYGNIRYPFGTAQQSNLISMIHDAFQPLSYWKGFQTPPQFQGVIMDTHIYQVFSNGDIHMTQSQHIQSICSRGSSLASFDLWVLVGEWSPARTDCARYLNGRGIGSRYDGTFPGSSRVGSCTGLSGKASTFSASYKTFLRKFWEAQVQTYEKGQGWLQWTWKAESADEWSYQAGLRNGWIPQNPTNYQFPNICG